MSRFFVGQRVRLVRPVFSENTGKSGRIRELFDDLPSAEEGPPVNCYVNWDNGERDGHLIHGYNGRATHTSRLEPILDQHTPGSWDAIEDLLPNIRERVTA